MQGQKKRSVWPKAQAEAAYLSFRLSDPSVLSGPGLCVGTIVCLSCSLLVACCRHQLFCYSCSASCKAGELSVSAMAEPWGRCSMDIHEERFLCKASGHFREGDVGSCPAIFSPCECQLLLCGSLGVRQRHRENGMYK